MSPDQMGPYAMILGAIAVTIAAGGAASDRWKGGRLCVPCAAVIAGLAVFWAGAIWGAFA